MGGPVALLKILLEVGSCDPSVGYRMCMGAHKLHGSHCCLEKPTAWWEACFLYLYTFTYMFEYLHLVSLSVHCPSHVCLLGPKSGCNLFTHQPCPSTITSWKRPGHRRGMSVYSNTQLCKCMYNPRGQFSVRYPFLLPLVRPEALWFSECFCRVEYQGKALIVAVRQTNVGPIHTSPVWPAEEEWQWHKCKMRSFLHLLGCWLPKYGYYVKLFTQILELPHNEPFISADTVVHHVNLLCFYSSPERTNQTLAPHVLQPP